ncbi:hypothetical protein [Streptomyces griseosporeus]|uniref:hypothetical protein n=1 Tax=Streptomyces griseosporeus TaxID=1910 RepID=UPI00167DA0A3|nr:hypothetical protein [Streptomyces griseosporeus]GHF70119.1 hypothetical protein GCM10018783_44610 [Streptomyces griseosporeus]
MKKALVGAAAAGLLLTASGTALAAWAGTIPKLHSPGVQFTNGTYKFNPPSTNHGAFEWQGRLVDADANDGHNVYMLVRIEAHDWVRYYGKQKRAVDMHHSNWDGAQMYTHKVKLKACRDRGSLHPDNCSRVQGYTNPRDPGN